MAHEIYSDSPPPGSYLQSLQNLFSNYNPESFSANFGYTTLSFLELLDLKPIRNQTTTIESITSLNDKNQYILN